jgi:hypothetical protein
MEWICRVIEATTVLDKLWNYTPYFREARFRHWNLWQTTTYRSVVILALKMQ